MHFIHSYINNVRFCDTTAHFKHCEVRICILEGPEDDSIRTKTCYHNTIILTYSMLQSPSWEANWFAASKEIPCISRNPKVHYRTHKRPPPVSILGQPNPVHIPTYHLLEIHPNIIHPSAPRSPQWSPSLRFPHQDPIHPLSSPIRATCPAHLIHLCTCIESLYNVVLVSEGFGKEARLLAGDGNEPLIYMLLSEYYISEFRNHYQNCVTAMCRTACF